METRSILIFDGGSMGLTRYRPLYGGLLFIVILLLTNGCSSGGNPRPLNRELARESMSLFLQTWQNGGSLEELKVRSPSIVGMDPDWDSGRKLISFELPADDENDGSNLYLNVKLTMKDGKGEPRISSIRYVIGTKPVISIFRDN